MTATMGIVSTGMFLPDTVMTAEDIAEASGLPLWVVTDKLGIEKKHVAGPGVHPNEMAAKAARQALEEADMDPGEIDVVLCTTEEWKEYALWTAGIDLAEQIGATNAWGMDVHMRCATTIAALKLARSLMGEDSTVNTVLIAGGYVISEFIDFTDPETSFLFNIGAGAGAMIVKRDWPENRVLGSHLMSDGSMSRNVLVPASGTVKHPTDDAVSHSQFKFHTFSRDEMGRHLDEVSIPNWMSCVDEALRLSGTKPDGSSYKRDDVDYMNMLLVKPSAHKTLLDLLGLREDQSVYLGHIGHIGEQDSIISIIEAERLGRLRPGDLMVMVGAGIGYVWGAIAVLWGPAQ